MQQRDISRTNSRQSAKGNMQPPIYKDVFGMKKLIAIALAGMMGLCSLSFNISHNEYKPATAYAADEYTQGTFGNFNYRNYSTYTVISGTTGSLVGAVTVPETIDGLPVLTIYPNVFKGQDKMTSLSLPSTVKNIPDEALCRAIAVLKDVIGA